MNEEYIYVPDGKELIPLPKSDYCTIKITHYIDLVLAEQKLDTVCHLVKSKQYDAAFEVLAKWNLDKRSEKKWMLNEQ